MLCPEVPPLSMYLAISTTISLVYLFAIYIFLKCRKLAYNVKFWLLHTLGTNFLACIFIDLSAVLNIVDKESYSSIIRCCNEGARFGGHTSLLMMSAMGIDRLLSLWCNHISNDTQDEVLKQMLNLARPNQPLILHFRGPKGDILQFNIRYHLYVTRRRMKIYAFILYVVGCMSVVAGFIGEERICPYVRLMITTYFQGLVSVSMFTIFTTLNVVVYTIVGVVALKKRRVIASAETSFRSNDYNRFLKLTAKSFSFVLLCLFFIIPASISQIYAFSTEGSLGLPTSARFISRLMVVFILLLPVVSVASYQESRYRFMRLLCYCNKRYQDKLIRKFKQRYASYDIFTVERRMGTEV